MTTDVINGTEPDAKPGAMTNADCAHLFRSVEHAITYGRLPSPTCVDTQPAYGYATLRFAEDDIAAVQEWAALIGATVVHGTTTYDTGRPDRSWHEFGTRPGGEVGRLAHWRVDLWCSVNAPAPEKPAADAWAALDDAVRNVVTGAESADTLAADVQVHRQSSGWNNGFTLGGSGVNCTCGVIFDGFDSIAEASESLKLHIADAATATQAGE